MTGFLNLISHPSEGDSSAAEVVEEESVEGGAEGEVMASEQSLVLGHRLCKLSSIPDCREDSPYYVRTCTCQNRKQSLLP